MSGIRTLVRETMSEAARCGNTSRPLTRSTSTLPKEGLAMKATRTCSVDGCEKPVHSREWCGAHYQRWARTGTPDGRKRPRADCSVDECDKKSASRNLCATHLARLRRSGTTDAYAPVSERFDLFVPRAGATECWEWLGPRNNKNYGKIGLLYAHRVACERANGPAPDDQPFALHSCDNPPCVNPAHLSWGTPSRNGLERWARTGKRRAQ